MNHLDDPQNRPGSPPSDLEPQTRPLGAPAPHPTPGGGPAIDPPETIDLTDTADTDDTKDVAKQEGQQLTEDARAQAREVAGTARESVAEVADEAKHQAVDLAEDARRQLHDQARQQTDHLGDAIQDLGHKLHALADGRTEETGRVGDYTDRVADQVERIGVRVQELGFDGTVDELQRFARRRPGVFLLGAAAAGFAVSRLGRGAKDAQEQDQGEHRRTQQLADDRSTPAGEPREMPHRAGQPPLAGQAPTGQPPLTGQPPAVSGGVPSDISRDVPPPPPAVPAPDPTMPRGRP
jgi:hypothetical protein